MRLGMAIVLVGLMSPSQVTTDLPYVSGLLRLEHEAMVNVFVVCPDKIPDAAGSGVIVSAHRILTVKHLLSCADHTPASIKISLRDGRMAQAKIERLEGEIDRAQLVLADEEKPFRVWARIRSNPPAIGQRLCAVAGLYRIRKCGWVAGMNGKNMIVSVRAIPGDSGSPMYDGFGHVRGLLFARNGDEGGEFLAMVVLAEVIR